MIEDRPLTVALPTRNEIKSIASMIDRLRAIGCEVFVVDSRSEDGTIEAAEAKQVKVYQRDEFGAGYGCGIQKALQVAHELDLEYIGIIDCDTTYSPEDFPKLLEVLSGKDLVVGARPMANIGFWHRMANYLHIYWTRLLFSQKVQDVNSGMRILKVNRFYKHLTATHMGMVAQMTSFALRNKLSYKEVDIRYGKRLGKSKIRIWDTLFIAYRILSERLKKRRF